ncbi:MAG: DUF881 domain-containing protein [Patescibacteria group bacterium]|jgi:uncharacterized protein YlxW (UPF0749 family)
MKSNNHKNIVTKSLLLILSIGFGVLISAQIRSLPTIISNPIAPYASLKETKGDLSGEQSELKQEIEALHQQIAEFQAVNEGKVLSRQEIADLNLKKANAGVTKLNGSGVIVTLDDSKSGTVTEENIVHAADLRDVVYLMWANGAEAISVNGQRVVVNTAIDCIVNTILINDVRLATPFRIEAIGPEEILFSKLSDQNILSDLHHRHLDKKLVFETVMNNDITVPIYTGSSENAVNTAGSNI